MSHDMCKKMVGNEDESFANLANPRELPADENHLCKISAGSPFPLTTFSASNISFSTCTVAEPFGGESALQQSLMKKAPKPQSSPKQTKPLKIPTLSSKSVASPMPGNHAELLCRASLEAEET